MLNRYAARLFLPLLLAAACLPLRAEERAGAIFHYDGRYGISFKLSSAVGRRGDPKMSARAAAKL